MRSIHILTLINPEKALSQFSKYTSMQSKLEHQSPFLLKEQPSVSLARPPVGWHNTVWQFPQTTTVCE